MLGRIISMIVVCAVLCSVMPWTSFAAVLENDPFNWDVPALSESEDAARKARLQLDVDTEYDLNILLIGCSFGADTMNQAPALLKALYPDMKFNIGRLFRGSTPIKDHYDYSQNEQSVYAYIEHYYNGSGNVGSSTLFSTSKSPQYLCNMQLAIDRADWDIVILQTTSGYCAMDGSYATEEINYVKALREYVLSRIKANNPDAAPEFCWNMVWAYPTFSENAKFLQFDKNPLKMYEGIIRNVQTHVVEADTGIDYVIPNGTAVINAIGNGIEDKFMYRDNEHMSSGDTMKQYLGTSYTGDGYFTAGLTAACTLALNSEVIKNISGVDDYTVTSSEDRLSKIETTVDTAMANTAANLYPEHKPLIVQGVKEALKYPFVSVSNADRLIQGAEYTFETAELAGKTEADVKALLADRVNAVADVCYTGVDVTADDITLFNYSEDAAANEENQEFEFTVAYENGTVSSKLDASSSGSAKLSVSSDFGTEGVVGAVCDLNFRFNMPVLPETAVPENIVLGEEIKGTSLYNVRSYGDYEYDEASNTYTIHFGEGDLAANTKYSITLSTDIATADGMTLSAEKTYYFTTTASGGWYINDNFSRYPADTSLALNNTTVTDLLPLQYGRRANNSEYSSRIVAGAEGRNAFQVSSYSTYDADSAYSSAGLRPDYMPDTTQTKIKSCEVEFDFYGDSSAFYGVYTNLITIAQMPDGKFYICGRKDGLGTEYTDTTKNNYYKNNLTPICEISELDQQNPFTHTLSFKMYSDYKTSQSYQRRLYDIYLDGEKITRVVDGSVTENGAAYTDFPANGIVLSSYIDTASVLDLNYAETTDDMRGEQMFTAWVDTTGSGEDKKEANLRIYSFKYGECPSLTSNVKNDALGVPCDTDILLSFATPLSSSNDYSQIGVAATENEADVEFEYTLVDSNTLRLSFDKNVYMDYRIDIPSFKSADGLPLDTCSISFKTESLGFEHTDNGSLLDGESGTLSVDKTFSLYDRAVSGGIDCKLIFAIYEDGHLICASVDDATTSSATDTAVVTVNKTITGCSADKEYTYKAFAVNSLSDIKPLTLSKYGNIE